LGLLPAWPEPLLAAAARAIVVPGEAGKLKLEPWHGVTPELGLSVASLALGAAAFVRRDSLRRALEVLRLGQWGPQRLYELSLSGLKGLAQGQTRVLQNGSLHRYLSLTVLALVGLLALPLVTRLGVPQRAMGELRFYEGVVLALMVVTAFVSVRTKSVLTALMALGVLGLAEAMVYVLLGAPDLALTQVVVQTLTVILFALVFSRFPVRPHGGRSHLRDAALSLVAGGLISWALLHTTTRPRHTRLAEAYTALSPTEAHGLNIVNVILVDFRALDTLGEATVLAIASLGVYLLFRTRRQRRRV
jgi:multicomponent Na+:H+ antiporter subunit A